MKVVQGLEANLVSVGKLCDAGERALVFTKDSVFSTYTHNIDSEHLDKIGSRQSDGLYDANYKWLLSDCEQAYGGQSQEQTQIQTNDPKQRKHSQNVRTVPSDARVLWHQRLGHQPIRSIVAAVNKGLIKGPPSLMSLTDYKKHGATDHPLCPTCAGSKFVRHAKPLQSHDKARATHPFHTICIDTAGPVNPASRRKNRWYLVIIDVYSNAIWVYPMTRKNDAAAKVEQFLTEVVGKQKIDQVEIIKHDGARELEYGDLRRLFLEAGITNLQVTGPNASHQNARAERAVRTVTLVGRSILNHTNGPANEWDYAVQHGALITRLCPCTANPDNQAPIQRLRYDNTPVDLKHLRTFYAPVYFYDLKTATTKGKRFKLRAQPGYFVGYANKRLTSYLVRSKRGKVLRVAARDITFYEDLSHAAAPLPPTRPKTFVVGDDGVPHPVHSEEEKDDEGHSEQDEDTNSDSDDSDSPDDQPSRRSSRERRPRIGHNAGASQQELIDLYQQQRHNLAGHVTDFSGYAQAGMLSHSKLEKHFTPRTRKEAMACEEKQAWQAAEAEEFENLISNDVFELVNRPPGAKVIRYKYVYKNKYGADGKLQRKKVRLTVMGCTQVKGINYFLTYSPTLSHSTLRLVFWLIVEHNMYVLTFDIKAAFLAADLDSATPIYMTIPEGLSEYLKKDLSDKVIRLKKSLYGLKQAPREFNKMLTGALKELGFRPLVSDPCLFIKREKDNITSIAIWVDDGIVTQVIEGIKKIFKLGTVAPLYFFLGMEIKYRREQGRLTISTRRYTEDLEARFGPELKKRSTPFPPGLRLEKPTGDIKDRMEFQLTHSYRELVGSLLYISTTSRPDISFAVSRLTKHVQDYDKTHWRAALHVLAYLSSTKDQVLCFRHSAVLQNKQVRIRCWTDSSWADCKDTSQSSMGLLVYLGDSLIIWRSKSHKNLVLSTARRSRICDWYLRNPRDSLRAELVNRAWNRGRSDSCPVHRQPSCMGYIPR